MPSAMDAIRDMQKKKAEMAEASKTSKAPEKTDTTKKSVTPVEQKEPKKAPKKKEITPEPAPEKKEVEKKEDTLPVSFPQKGQRGKPKKRSAGDKQISIILDEDVYLNITKQLKWGDTLTGFINNVLREHFKQ